MFGKLNDGLSEVSVDAGELTVESVGLFYDNMKKVLLDAGAVAEYVILWDNHEFFSLDNVDKEGFIKLVIQ